MQQPATKNVFTRPLPPLPSLDEQSEYKEQPDYAVNRTALMISVSTFIHGLFLPCQLEPAARQLP